MNNKKAKKVAVGGIASGLAALMVTLGIGGCNRNQYFDDDTLTTTPSITEENTEFKFEEAASMYDNPEGFSVEDRNEFKEVEVSEAEAAALYFAEKFDKIPLKQRNTMVLTNASIALMTNQSENSISGVNRTNVLGLVPKSSRAQFTEVLNLLEAGQGEQASNMLMGIINSDSSLGARAIAINLGLISRALYDYTGTFAELSVEKNSATTVLAGNADDAFRKLGKSK